MAIQAVVALLESPDANARLHAVVHIRRKGIIQAADALVRRLPDEDDYLREAITGALADLQQEQSRETLVELLRDPSPTVRRLAIRGLAALDDARSIDAANDLYASGGRFEKYEALDALATVRDQAAEPTLDALLAGETSWRWRRRIRKAMRKRKRR